MSELNKIYTSSEIARMIDISAVRTDATIEEIDKMAEAAKKYKLIAAFAMPCFTEYLVGLLADTPEVRVGGVAGFPSGADTTEGKVFCAKQMLAVGADEIDMVINVGALKSGMNDLVKNDIHAIVEAAEGRPVKSIIELCYLTDDEIKRAATLAVEAGVTYVKTGTGWGPTPTEVRHIALIKETIGDSAKIKAAGGVRSLQTLLDMTDAGCSRFGISLNSCIKIMEEAISKLDGKN